MHEVKQQRVVLEQFSFNRGCQPTYIWNVKKQKTKKLWNSNFIS